MPCDFLGNLNLSLPMWNAAALDFWGGYNLSAIFQKCKIVDLHGKIQPVQLF